MNAIAGVVGAQRAVLIVEERIEVEVEDRFAVRQLRDGGVALVDDLVFEVGAIRLLLRGVEDGLDENDRVGLLFAHEIEQ